jgi:hypothetical protein
MDAKVNKKSDKPIFKEIIDMIPAGIFKKIISQFKSDKHCLRTRPTINYAA